MIKDGLVQWVQTLNIAELLNYSKDDLETLLGKDFAVMKGYSQNNPHHCFDLLEHTVKTAEALDCNGISEIEALELRIAALFHDVGKPLVASDKNGRTVFYNHAVKSREIAEEELCRYDLERCSLDRILFYIEHHDDFISFKLKTDISGKGNPFIFLITLETVYNRILKTQDECRINCNYVPTVYDYSLLMRLCIADAKAQSVKVFKDGMQVDSLEDKLVRLRKIALHIAMIRNAEKERCDLHTHSVYSDGTDTPRELVSKAFASGLRVVALTDHNTIDGLNEFMGAAKNYEIEAVPGIEFSTEYEGHELHVVGLFINQSSHRKINRYLNKAKEAKDESNRNFIENLKKNGYAVSYEEIETYAGNSNINRAVIGQYLLSKGIIPSVQEGFKTILSKKSGYYIPPKRPSTLDTIKFIKSINAVAVLAHPLLDLSPDELQAFLPLAKEAGIDAIETYYSLFTDKQREWLTQIATDNNLLESGGSDYHGLGKPRISLGTGEGDLSVPVSAYLQMIKNFQH